MHRRLLLGIVVFSLLSSLAVFDMMLNQAFCWICRLLWSWCAKGIAQIHFKVKVVFWIMIYMHHIESSLFHFSFTLKEVLSWIHLEALTSMVGGQTLCTCRHTCTLAFWVMNTQTHAYIHLLVNKIILFNKDKKEYIIHS